MTLFALGRSTHYPAVGPGLALLVPLLASLALMTGCGNASPSTAQGPVVTVTATPTVTAGRSSAPPTAATPTMANPLKSDVVGRNFDLGTIVKVVKDGGAQVLIFDRWTARGVADSKLAANGVAIGVHSDAPYENLNSRSTFRIPVVAGAIFTYNHCVAVDQPAQQRSSTLQEFAGLRSPENIMLLSLDPQGRAYKAQNDPAC